MQSIQQHIYLRYKEDAVTGRKIDVCCINRENMISKNIKYDKKYVE